MKYERPKLTLSQKRAKVKTIVKRISKRYPDAGIIDPSQVDTFAREDVEYYFDNYAEHYLTEEELCS